MYTYPPPPPQTSSGRNPPPTNGQDDDTGEGSDAWEAAQNILKAINFGSLIQMGKDEQKRYGMAGGDGENVNPAGGQNHPPPVIASDVNLMGGSTQATETSTHSSGVVLTPGDRASLQAQLALLAAQMAELAEGDDDSAIGDPEVIGAIASNPNAQDDREGDKDEDEDMKMIDVPVTAPAAVLST